MVKYDWCTGYGPKHRGARMKYSMSFETAAYSKLHPKTPSLAA